jgi:hypothetical protein
MFAAEMRNDDADARGRREHRCRAVARVQQACRPSTSANKACSATIAATLLETDGDCRNCCSARSTALALGGVAACDGFGLAVVCSAVIVIVMAEPLLQEI